MTRSRNGVLLVAGLLISAAAATAADTTITKKPDVGPFWNHVGPNNTLVYADSFFVPNGYSKIERLGTWLDDQGSGGSSLRFEVWGDNGGPDPSNIICTTGSVKPPAAALTYSEYGTSPGFVEPGNTYWFVVTGVGEAGPGAWQVGGHTQNSDGIVDFGTFWYANDGVDFDGQNKTPEMAFSVTLGPKGGSNNFYIRSQDGGAPWGETTNEDAMAMAFNTDWVDARYETVDVSKLFADSTRFIYLEGSDEDAEEMKAFIAANKTKMEDWVHAGGSLFINSAPNEGSSFALGFGEKLNVEELGDALTVSNAVYPAALGPYAPAGAAYSGNSASHAYLTGPATPVAVNEFGNATIAELIWGNGNVLFGALTTDNFWDPQPNAHNFRANLIIHASHVNTIPDEGYAVATDGHLYKIKLPFAAVFDVGDTGISQLESLAERPTDGKLYAIDAAGQFYAVNPNTGAATLKGNTGLGNVEGLDFVGDTATLLACDFGVGRPGIYEIALANGAPSFLIEGNASIGVVRAMAADGRDSVILCTGDNGALYSMDLSNGYLRYIGTIGAFIAAIDFSDSGLLYALDEAGNVYQVSLYDASTTYWGNTGGQFWLDMTAHTLVNQEPDCYADFDGNGVLDLFDFLAYVNAFNAHDQKANCDGNGSLDLFDFLCYVNAFNAGC